MATPKLSPAQALAFLKLLGVDLAEFGTEDAADYKDEELLKVVDEERLKILEPQIAERLKKDFEGGYKGRMLGTVRTAAARKLGIDKALLEKSETVEDILDLAVKGHETRFNQDAEGLRTEIKSQREEYEQKISDLNEKHRNEIQAATDRYTERDIDAALVEVVNKIPRTGGDPLRQAALLKSHLRSDYHLAWNEAERKLSLRDKNNREKPVYNGNDTKELEISGLAPGFFESLGVLKKDNRDVNPVNTLNQHRNNNSSQVLNPDRGQGDDALPQYAQNVQDALQRLASE